MTQTEMFKPVKLSPQCQILLDAFRYFGNLWNYEMANTLHILNYTGRISDLRRSGYTIKEIKKEGGSRLYGLEGKR